MLLEPTRSRSRVYKWTARSRIVHSSSENGERAGCCCFMCVSCSPFTWLSIPGVPTSSWYWIMGWTQSECGVAPVCLALFCPGVSLFSVRLSEIDVFTWNRHHTNAGCSHLLILPVWHSQSNTRARQTLTQTHTAAHAVYSQWTAGQLYMHIHREYPGMHPHIHLYSDGWVMYYWNVLSFKQLHWPT